jgi:peptidoglycan hydrolase-like protein with peptidoglycan-binding domain
MIARGWDLGPDGADGYYGPKGQTNPDDSYTGRAAKAFQAEKGLTVDGKIGPSTWDTAWTAPITPPGTPTTPVDPVPPTPDGEAGATPPLVTPKASDFPAWIRYEEKFDQQFSADPTWNLTLQNYYGKPYNPIEVHTHWWGNPGEAGSHDGNVDYLNRTKDVGANYVLSAARITLAIPLNKIALTTGQRNPFAWKVECDPLITTSVSNHGYKTLGFLVYLIEDLNPSLRQEAIRLHKEFYATSCSNIDVKMVRAYAEQFHSGALDPATGEAPVVDPGPGPDPEPEPESVLVPKELADRILAADSVLSGLLGEAFK